MLGEVVGRQLGEGEWEAEGGEGPAGLPLAPAPTSALSMKAGGGWETGPPRGGGHWERRLRIGLRPSGKPEGRRRVFWGMTRL